MAVGGLTNRQAEAICWKERFSIVRNGHATYAGEARDVRASSRACFPSGTASLELTRMRSSKPCISGKVLQSRPETEAMTNILRRPNEWTNRSIQLRLLKELLRLDDKRRRQRKHPLYRSLKGHSGSGVDVDLLVLGVCKKERVPFADR